MDVVVWLRSLGLGKYEAAFRENEIDDRPELTKLMEALAPSNVVLSCFTVAGWQLQRNGGSLLFALSCKFSQAVAWAR